MKFALIVIALYNSRFISRRKILSIPFIEDNDQTLARREHLEALRALVGNVYPNKFERSQVVEAGREDTITSIGEKFHGYEPKASEGGRPAAEEIELANQQLNQIAVRLAGRIASPPRVMGKAAFVHLSDGVARLQVYVRKADVKATNNDTRATIEDENAGWELFGLLDHGDFIGVEGYLFVTKTGELSVHVQTLQFLAKALLPLPDKMHGIHDPEIRQRQRYADLIAGSLKLEEREEGELTPREVFERRSQVIREMRRILEDSGYTEVETPMLTPLATGAAARPFKTHHNALDIDLYARIAPELYLKRLLVGGFEKVYELNRNFRNEGIDRQHNPEFTMLEFYWAYADVNAMMDFCEEMIRATVFKVLGHTHVRYGEHDIDFSQPFQRMTMKEMVAESWKLVSGKTGSPLRLNAEMLDDPLTVFYVEHHLSEWLGAPIFGPGSSDWDSVVRGMLMGEDFSKIAAANPERISASQLDEITTANRVERIFDHLYGAQFKEGAKHPGLFKLRELMDKPVFITGYPKVVSPLSKASPVVPGIAERFEFFVAGLETANGFSELNDPEEQYQRFNEQVEQRQRGDEEAMVMDEDYIRALSYGMPPAAGIGIGIDRFVMLLTNRQSIRDVILFPHLRPERKQDELNPADSDSIAP
jgi:lysyl-tRNA synthetase class 2